MQPMKGRATMSCSAGVMCASLDADTLVTLTMLRATARVNRMEPPPLPPPTSRAGSRSRRRHRRHRLPPRARGETSSPPPSSRFGWRLRPDSRAGVTSAALRTVAGLDLGPPRRCRPRPPPSAPSPAATAAVLRARGRRRREPPPPPLPASAQSTSMPASG
uniref:Uncharacterized protein n=1 Tax=Oryza nivara TaxID=4536 RepID=A0A0E0G9Q0_ORYNI